MTNRTNQLAPSQSAPLAIPFAAVPAESIAHDPTGGQQRTVLGILRCLRRRWRMALGLGVVFGVLGALAIWLFLPPSKPFAFAKIYFPSNPERTLNEHPDPPLKELTQKERILSRKLLTKVVARPEVVGLNMLKDVGDPAAFLARELTVEFPLGTEIMRITLHGDQPKELAILVNAVKDTYLEEIANESERKRSSREAALRQLLAEAEREYNRARDEARRKSEGIGSANPETIAFKQQRLENELYTAEGDRRAAVQRVGTLKKELELVTLKLNEPIDVNDVIFEPVFMTDDEIVFLTKLRKETERRLVERKRLVAEDHPSIREIEGEIKLIQSKIEDRKKELRPSGELRVRQKLMADLTRLKSDLSAEELQVAALEHKIDTLNKEAKSLANATINVETSSKDLYKLKDERDDLERALKRQLTERDAPIRAGTLEDAIIVYPNEASRRMKFAGFTFAAVLLMTMLGFAIAELRARRIASPNEVAHGIGVPVMGTVPSRPSRYEHAAPEQPVNAEQVLWDRLIDESVDSARTIFLHTAEAGSLRVVQVTSAVGSEGKTSLSCQLAKSLARSGRRVLLIDGDLRSPAIDKHFAVSPQPGVCEVLRRETSLESAIRPSELPNLALLPAGRCDKLAIQQLAMDGFRKLIAEVRGAFDFVLIDSCPVLPVADTLLMARYADGILLSLMCDVSQVERVQTACQKLAAIGANVVGAVLHGTGTESYGYGSRYLMPHTQPTAI